MIALRVVLGLLILFTGVGKALDLAGFAAIVTTYQLGLSGAQLWFAAYGVTAFELLLGGWLLSGWGLRRAGWAALLLNLSYGVLLTASLLRGLELSNCGCFGVFFAQPLRWYSPLEDVLLMAASATLIRKAGQ